MCVYDDYINMISNWQNDWFIKDKQIISEVILLKIIL